jgi:hypothetical protein
MSLLNELRKKESQIQSIGERTRAEAKEQGASFSYIDPDDPEVIVVETDETITRHP